MGKKLFHEGGIINDKETLVYCVHAAKQWKQSTTFPSEETRGLSPCSAISVWMLEKKKSVARALQTDLEGLTCQVLLITDNCTKDTCSLLSWFQEAKY